jgi:hypothetical protein
MILMSESDCLYLFQKEVKSYDNLVQILKIRNPGLKAVPSKASPG